MQRTSSVPTVGGVSTRLPSEPTEGPNGKTGETQIGGHDSDTCRLTPESPSLHTETVADRDSDSDAVECGSSVASEFGGDSGIDDAELASEHLSGPVIDASELITDEEREMSIKEGKDVSADDSGSAIISACAEIMGTRLRKESGS